MALASGMHLKCCRKYREIMTHIEEYAHTTSNCVCCGGNRISRSSAILMPFIAHRIYQWEPALIDESWGLQTIPNGRAYSLCNSLLCDQCGLLFLDIRFTDGELALLYRNYRDEAYTALRELYEPGYRKRNEGIAKGMNYLNKVEEFLQPLLPAQMRVLDWGGDTGINTPFKSKGANTIHVYDISDIETTGGVRKVCKETVTQNSYDLIVCSNVLEHVPFPRRLLGEIRTAMTPTTVLYIEVPLENLRKKFIAGKQLLGKKRHWHEHINFFSRPSLEALVSSVGLSLQKFQILDILCDGQSYSQYMLSCCLPPASSNTSLDLGPDQLSK